MLASEIIRNNIEVIKKKISEIIVNGDFNYRNFGTAIEGDCERVLKELLIENGISESDLEFAENKNVFPDLKVKTSTNEAIDYKSGNHSKKEKGKWVECSNSENDLGTINSFPKKIEQFGGENIYFFWIEYNINDTNKELIDIKFDNFYKFIGLSPDGLLRYRKKDGNLRPKDFDQEPPIKTFKELWDLFERTEVKRSISISEQHLGVLKNKLKKKYDLK